MVESPQPSPLTDLDSPALFPIELPSEVVPDCVAPTCKRKRTVLDYVDLPLLNYKAKRAKITDSEPFTQHMVIDCDNGPQLNYIPTSPKVPRIGTSTQSADAIQIQRKESVSPTNKKSEQNRSVFRTETIRPSTSADHVLADPVPDSRKPATTATKAASTSKGTTNNATAHHMSCTRCFGSAARPTSIPARDPPLSMRRILETKKKSSSQTSRRLSPATNAQGPALKKVSAPSRGISKAYTRNAPRSTAAPLSRHRSSAGKTSIGASGLVQAFDTAVTENHSAIDQLDVRRDGKRTLMTSTGNTSTRSLAHIEDQTSQESRAHTEKHVVSAAASVSPHPAGAVHPAVHPCPGRRTSSPPSGDSASSPAKSTAPRSTTAPLGGHRGSTGQTSVGASGLAQAFNMAVTANYSALDVGRGGSDKRTPRISTDNTSTRLLAHTEDQPSRESRGHTTKPVVSAAASVSLRPVGAADPESCPGRRPTPTSPRCSGDSPASSPTTSTVDRLKAARSISDSLTTNPTTDNLSARDTPSQRQRQRNHDHPAMHVASSNDSSGMSSSRAAAADRSKKPGTNHPSAPTRVGGDFPASFLAPSRPKGMKAPRSIHDSPAPNTGVSNSASKGGSERSIASTSGTVYGEAQTIPTAGSNNLPPISPKKSTSVDAVEASSSARTGHIDAHPVSDVDTMERLVDIIGGLQNQVYNLQDQIQGYQQQAYIVHGMMLGQVVGLFACFIRSRRLLVRRFRSIRLTVIITYLKPPRGTRQVEMA
ncbi:hypothetical protein H0H87_002183 [Tephrocybe sp. NHM501043]|nr:hypothetical protein H0H87_002183 [Tephrocybe sp. NHM501043]